MPKSELEYDERGKQHRDRINARFQTLALLYLNTGGKTNLTTTDCRLNCPANAPNKTKFLCCQLFLCEDRKATGAWQLGTECPEIRLAVGSKLRRGVREKYHTNTTKVVPVSGCHWYCCCCCCVSEWLSLVLSLMLLLLLL